MACSAFFRKFVYFVPDRHRDAGVTGSALPFGGTVPMAFYLRARVTRPLRCHGHHRVDTTLFVIHPDHNFPIGSDT